MGMNYDSNNEYSVPYFWGTLGIIYNYELVDAADLTGWDVLWNEKYENNIYMYDGVRDAFTPALLDLGYSLNSTNDSELEEAKNHLIDQLPILRGFGTDDIKYLVSSGDAALGVTFNGDFLDMVYEIEEAEEEVTVGYFVPENGTNLWFDAMVIPNTAQNPELAEKFMNFISSPENAQLNTEWVGYSTVNKTAYDNMFNDEDYVEWVTDPSYYPSNDVINASEVYIDLGEYNEVYDMLFTEVKSNN
jgi:spermidine/putrescine transport system substrate-binding protein